MYCAYLNFYKYTIKIETNNLDLLQKNAWFKNFTVTNNSCNYNFIFRYFDLKDNTCTFDSSGVFCLCVPFVEIENTEIIKTILMVCTQWVLQKNNVFMLHASCAIDTNGEACAFWGNSGSGKTTISIEQCVRKNWKYYSNGSMLVKNQDGKLKVVNTIKKNIKIRYSSYIRQNPEKASALFNRVNENTFDQKMVIRPEEIGVESVSGEFNLKRLYFIKLMNDCFFTKPISYRSLVLLLYRDLSRFVRASDVYLLYGDNASKTLLFPSMDSAELHQNRIDFINAVFNSISVSMLHGSLDQCIEYIS